MAVYKVPQDVEADDKLLGPFSFRQFIYLIVVALAIAAAWGLWTLLPPLVIIPLPVILLFGVLALPLRKDQPMETYVSALVSFYIKPRKRLWEPDGVDSLVEISAPKMVEVQRTKNLSQGEAVARLSYLADIVDTQGWSVRGVAMPTTNSPMNTDVYYEAQQTEDILDDNNTIARNIDERITETATRRHQEVMQRMQQTSNQQPQAAPAPAPAQPAPSYQPADPYAQLQPAPQPPVAQPQQPVAPVQPAPAQSEAEPQLHFNPYPSNIRQSVLQPLSDDQLQPAPQAAVAPEPAPAITTSEKQPSPDIISLANNADLSIETIAREANRIHDRERLEEEEVVISLR